MREKQFIERGELINRFEENLKYQEDNKHWEVARRTRVAINVIRNLPAADVVEVVRCKDCKHGRSIDKTKSPEKYYRDDCIVCECEDVVGEEPMVYLPSHFCSYGERKCDNG